MTGLLIMLLGLSVIGLFGLLFWWQERSQKWTRITKSYEDKISEAKKELAGLLGAPGVTDEVELDSIINNWLVCCYNKSRQLAGMSAHLALASLSEAGKQLPSKNFYSAHAYLGQAIRQLEYLKTQIDCLEPQ